MTSNNRHTCHASIMTLCILTASMLTPRVVQAQTACTAAPPSNSCSVDVSLALVTVRTMDLRLSGSDVAFPRAAAAELLARSVTSSAVNAIVKSNMPWQFQIALAGEQEPGRDGQRSDATSGLQWSRTPNGNFAQLGQTPSPVASGDAGAGHRITLHFRKSVDWFTTPGSYQHVISSTLIAP